MQQVEYPGKVETQGLGCTLGLAEIALGPQDHQKEVGKPRSDLAAAPLGKN